MDTLSYSESIFVTRSPEVLYDMVSNVTRMGEWSPVCKSCWWDEGSGVQVGSWFTGHNETAEQIWETRSVVVVAERPREFAFVVGESIVRWGYTFTPVDQGTEITESWEFLPSGVTVFEGRYGAEAQSQIANRAETARQGIPATLAAIKRIAESN